MIADTRATAANSRPGCRGRLLPCGPVPRVSVIIPAHDAAAFIEQTLASVAAQSYADWEVILTDDASADDTAQRAAAAPARAQVVRSEHNLGPAGARNLALERASGELVALL